MKEWFCKVLKALGYKISRPYGDVSQIQRLRSISPIKQYDILLFTYHKSGVKPFLQHKFLLMRGDLQNHMTTLLALDDCSVT